MEKFLKISFFKSYSRDSEVLKDMLDKNLREYLRNQMGIESSFHLEESRGLIAGEDTVPSALKVQQAAFNNELVIIDASIEDVDGCDFGENYECITPAVSSLDNILVVSRTQLPLNFIPCRSNVPGLGERDFSDSDSFEGFDKVYEKLRSLPSNLKPNNDITSYRKSYSNEYILEWIECTLEKMNANGRLLRSDELRLDLSSPSGDLHSREMEIMGENISAVKREKGNKKRCFISYRSKYFDEKYDGRCSIVDAAHKIDSLHQENEPGQWARPFYYPRGVLSVELMPEIRRWAFIALPDRVIRDSDEFWIFETKAENGKESAYWDSWWCLGEFITIMRMKHNHQLKEGFKVMVFNPDDDTMECIPIESIPEIDDEQNQELARYFANSDFLEAGYESMDNMRLLRKKSLPARWMHFQMLKKFFFPIYMGDDDTKDYTFKQFNSSIKSHVYDENFMKDRIYIDSDTPPHHTREKVFSDKNIAWKFMNVNGVYDKLVERFPGSMAIHDGDENNLIRTNEHFFILWTPKFGKRSGPNGEILERVDIMTFKK